MGARGGGGQAQRSVGVTTCKMRVFNIPGRSSFLLLFFEFACEWHAALLHKPPCGTLQGLCASHALELLHLPACAVRNWFSLPAQWGGCTTISRHFLFASLCWSFF